MVDTQYFIEALARGLDVLALFSREHPSLSMSEVVQRTGLNKTTAYRVLSTLEATGYLERDPRTRHYRPSLKVMQLGFTALNSLDIRQIARPHLENLAREQDLTTSLSMLDGKQVVYLDRIRNREIVGVLLGLGDHIPAHCSSMGKAILAHLPLEELELRLSDIDLTPCTSYSITTKANLLKELKQVREQGYALNNGELASGLRAVAAPVFNHRKEVVAAINVSGNSEVIDEHRLKNVLPPRILEIANHISHWMETMEVSMHLPS